MHILMWGLPFAIIVAVAVGYAIWLPKQVKSIKDAQPAYASLDTTLHWLRHELKIVTADLRDGLLQRADVERLMGDLEQARVYLAEALTIMPAEA